MSSKFVYQDNQYGGDILPLYFGLRLLRKAAHGRISATRDEAYQLTLKIFKREGLDVKEALLREAVELINNVKL